MDIKPRYTGHVGSGGLQGHSVSSNYPWIVVGYGHPTRYVAENMVTGEKSVLSYDSARVPGMLCDAYAERDERNRLVAAAARNTEDRPEFGPSIEPDEDIIVDWSLNSVKVPKKYMMGPSGEGIL